MLSIFVGFQLFLGVNRSVFRREQAEITSTNRVRVLEVGEDVVVSVKCAVSVTEKLL